MGYPGFGYQNVWIWGGQSAIVMCVILDATIITMIASAIIRYISQKHRIEKNYTDIYTANGGANTPPLFLSHHINVV
ncbi:MAG TPA: hypothetical protein PLH98_18655 [Ruminococcus flavefaciens]|nr:hypothetical protein [Ruminococcus flavefaciens]